MFPVPRLCELPALMARVIAVVGDARDVRSREGGFALVEHVWHLADVEVEAFQARLTRLLRDPVPWLRNFDGDRVARERRYLSRAVAPGLRAFARARAATVSALARVPAGRWLSGGIQEGVGYVTLAELPERILGHDRAHVLELAALLDELRPESPMIGELHAWADAIVDPPAPPCGRTAPPPRTPSPLPLARVQRVVAASVSGRLDVDALGRALGIRPRTLQRRLADHGVTVRCLADAARRARAISRLRSGADWRVAAQELGFSDPRAFARAFKRWTRTTPAGFQRGLRITRRSCA